jgi:mono/diheme cytochrome c family protein
MRLWLPATAVLVMLCGALAAQNTSYQQDLGWRAPADAVSRANPLARKPEAAAGGGKLFKRNCVECHGEDGSGLAKKNAADLLLREVQSQSDGTLFWKITNGNTDRGMPSFSRLPELQRWQLVLYLRTLKPLTTPQAKDPGK